MKRKLFLCTALSLGVLVSCEKEQLINPDVNGDARVEIKSPEPANITIPQFSKVTTINNLNSKGEEFAVAVYMAEYITSGESGEIGNEVFFNNRGNKQLAGDFVPALALDGTPDVTYYVDENRPTADLPVAVSTAAIDRAMNTWDGVNCSDLGMTKIPYDGSPAGLVPASLGFGGSFNYFADVMHGGWLPGAFFDLLAPGGSSFILGVTFTIVFTDSNGDLVDTDNNGKYDVAWREIYYNDAFGWNDGSTYDVETVALHEAGHGLSQAHFGKAHRTISNGKIHFSPRAVMNAAYSGVQTNIGKSDNGGHCSNWGSWPNN
jgi:hypothetical protein